MWEELGFSESPYATAALPASEQGDRLLVGRDRELESLLNTLRYTGRHATLEGDNGVGKTSLVAIAAFRAKQARLQREKVQFLLPLEGTFQLSPDVSPAK
jgi:MoxR-like ATPase